MPRSQQFIDARPFYRASVASDEAKPALLHRLAKLGNAMIFSLIESRQKEAARIVALYANDRWTDEVERDVTRLFYSSMHPPRRD